MTNNPKVTAEERAAQCWCDPTTSRKVMDIELCLVIAKAIKSAEDSARAEALEEAASVVRGEIEIYEEQSKRVNPTRLKKIQGRWRKLKDIENRIHALSPNSDEKGGAA